MQKSISISETSLDEPGPSTALPPTIVEAASESDKNPSLNSSLGEKSDSFHSATSGTHEKERDPSHAEQPPETLKEIPDSPFEALVQILDCILLLNYTRDEDRQEKLDDVKRFCEECNDKISDEERIKIMHSYIEKLPEFVFIIIWSSKNRDNLNKIYISLLEKFNARKQAKTQEKLPPAETWQGTSREQVIERIKLHKSGLNLTFDNKKWQQTKRSFETIEPNFEENDNTRFGSSLPSTSSSS